MDTCEFTSPMAHSGTVDDGLRGYTPPARGGFMIDPRARLAIPVSVSDHMLGDPMAPITLLQYGDFLSADCADALPLLNQLQSQSRGQLRLVFRHFPSSRERPQSQMAAALAEAAALEGAFWEMHRWLYENQARWTDTTQDAIGIAAAELGLNGDTLAASLRTYDIESRIQRDFMGGIRSGVTRAPTYFINEQMMQGDVTALMPNLDAILKRPG